MGLDVVADLKAHRTPRGSTMASATTLHIGRPWHVRCTPQALDGPLRHATQGGAGPRPARPPGAFLVPAPDPAPAPLLRPRLRGSGIARGPRRPGPGHANAHLSPPCRGSGPVRLGKWGERRVLDWMSLCSDPANTSPTIWAPGEGGVASSRPPDMGAALPPGIPTLPDLQESGQSPRDQGTGLRPEK